MDRRLWCTACLLYTSALTNTVTATSDTLSATDTCTIEVEPEKDYSVTIAPADIVAYTGGRGYGSVVGGDGQLHDSVEGLPEPGYHISLSEDAIEWLAEQVGSIEPQEMCIRDRCGTCGCPRGVSQGRIAAPRGS